MSSVVQRIATPVLHGLRERFGRRIVNWTPDFMGFGNQLYLWVWAWERRDDPVIPMVLTNARTEPWLPEVPAFARRFLVAPGDVRFLDQRTHAWAEKVAVSGHAQGFSPSVRHSFITEGLADEPLLAGVSSSPWASESRLTVVVRRGDFYTPQFRYQFGFDVRSYVELAVSASIERDGAVEAICVVSDDLDWCREHLQALTRHAPVEYASPTDSPADNFRLACAARRLVITNGTFCVWAAFISRALHGQDPGLIWAPAFFQTTYGEGRCVEYDQDFSFIDDLPDGWQPEWVLEGLDDPRPPAVTPG